MNFLATIFVSSLLVISSFSQTTKPKPVAAKANPTVAKPKTSASKNNPIAPNPSANLKGKTAAAKPKTTVPKATNEADENAEFEKAAAVTDGSERIAALKKFIKAFPASKRATDAHDLIVTVHSQLGNDKLAAGDVEGAVKFYKAAIKDAPKPVPDQLFTETLAKFPANLYFRGARTEGFELARAIETKSNSSVAQLLSVATFYMSIENGSEARRVAESAIKLDPASPAAYQTLGLASRMDFLLDDSAAAYAKALEFEPDSQTARRGLAEMKRALGKADDAVILYREILAKDEADLPARTGLVLALFDAGERSDAEAELARTLEANPGNVILQAGAAYWYAANGDGDKAVEFAQKAIASDPRFVWSHIALARGYVAQKNPVAAEKTLIAARRYGNFPTLEYEIASARVAAGFYREAAEELAKSFSVKEGIVYTNLGGRVYRGSKDFADLVGFERRASIFAPTGADSPEASARMTALLELKQELDQPTPKPDAIAKAADDFVHGDDKMKVYRLLFAGSQLLDKKIALPKVIELTKAAPAVLDAGLDASDPTAAVMASELYESRTIAAARGDYVSVPPVPRATLSSILRGRVEEINGWAYYQMEDPAQASIHLKRAVSVLPADSAWWRSSTWRLGTSLLLEGKNADALEMYIRSYKSQADPLRYNAIETLYKRVNGHTLGLENRIGPNPTPAVSTETVAQRPNPNQPSIPVALTKAEPTPVPTPEATPAPSPAETPKVVEEETKIESTPAATPEASPTPETTPVPTETQKVVTEEPKSQTTPEPTPEPSPTPTPETEPTPKAVTDDPKTETTPAPTPEPSPTALPTPTPEEIKVPVIPETTPSPTPEPTPEPTKTPEPKGNATAKLVDNTNGLFPPVVITIPPPPTGKAKTEPSPAVADGSDVVKPSPSSSPEQKTEDIKTSPTPETKMENKPVVPAGRPRVVVDGVPIDEIKPCTLTLDQENITVPNSGSDRAVIVRRVDDGDIEGVTAVSTSPEDVSVRREVIAGIKTSALFVLRSRSAKPGEFQVKFVVPCGKKEIVVKVE